MSWKETSPGRFERPLDTLELMFKAIGDQGKSLNREQWAVRVSARFRLNDTVGDAQLAVRHAWKPCAMIIHK